MKLAPVALCLALLPALLATSSMASADPPFIPKPAAVLDPAAFARSAPLTVVEAPDGAARLRLPRAVLAAAREDLADLRIIDAEKRQWPYVADLEVPLDELPLTLTPGKSQAGRSRFTLAPMDAPATVTEVALRVDRDFFDRAYVLRGDDGHGHETALASGRLSSKPPPPGGWLKIPIGAARVRSLVLQVDDGDEAPLPIAEAKARLRSAEVVLAAPAGSYTLLAGDDEARPPRYEIARASGELFKARPGQVELGPLRLNPSHEVEEAKGGRGDRDQMMLFGALGLAVLVLGGLSLRLAKKEPPRPAPPSDPREP